MIVYRDITYEEFKNMVEGKKVVTTNNYNGMHFFKYGNHAKMYLPDYGQMIISCDIPEYLIEEMDYVNHYPFKKFVVGAPIPEYIIDKDNFDYSFIEDTNPEIKKASDYRDGKLYNAFLEDMYKEWKKINNNYYNDKYGFYDYVVAYLRGKNLDEVISEYGNHKKRIRK